VKKITKYGERTSKEGIMKTNDNNQMTSPCGLNCADCEIYNGYNGRDPRNAKALIFFIRPFIALGAKFSTKKKITLRMLDRMMKIPKDQKLCNGCRNEDGHCLIHSTPGECKVYHCTKEKKIHNCSECSDFPCELLYPSVILADIAPHNTKIANLCLIKKYGVDTWCNEYSLDLRERYFEGDYPVDL